MYSLNNLYPQPGRVASRVTDDMHFFLKPEVNTGQIREHEVYVDCRNPQALNSNKEIEFYISGNDDFVKLKDTELQMDIQIIKKGAGERGYSFSNGAMTINPNTTHSENFPEAFLNDSVNRLDDPNFEAPEFVTPIDAFLHTQWKNIEFILGNTNPTTVTNTNNDQAYRSYMDIFLRTKDEDRDIAAYKWLYTRGTGKRRRNEPNPYISGDKGAIERSKRVRSGNIIQLAGRLYTDFLKNPQLLLLNGVNMFLKLEPNSNKFRFKVTPPKLEDEFEYKIVDIKLKLTYVTLRDNALAGISRVLLKSPIYYEYVKSDLKIFPMNAGRRDWRWPNIFGDLVPLDLVFVMVESDAFNGNFKKDPFYFSRNHLTSAAFCVNNTPIPAKPLDFRRMGNSYDPVADEDVITAREDEWAMRPLESLWAVAGSYHNGMNYKNYIDGSFMVGINTDPTVPADVEYWGVPKTGTTELQLVFDQPLPSETQLLILGRFPALLTINNKREVKIH